MANPSEDVLPGLAGKTSSPSAEKLVVRQNWMREFVPGQKSRFQSHLSGCCITQAPVGFGVTLKCKIRLWSWARNPWSLHLYHWLETNDYGRFLADNDL